jgi:hypothetical protein
MAKESVKESIIITHKLDAEGTLNLDNATFETETMGVVPISKLLARFNGKYIKLSATEKSEEDPEEIDDKEE